MRQRNGNWAVPTRDMTREEARALKELSGSFAADFGRANPADQLRIAGLVASAIKLAAPDLAETIGQPFGRTRMLRVRSVPVSGDGDQLTATILSVMRGGELFQYSEQLGGVLTAPIRPVVGSMPNSNSSPDPFGWHTDDAILQAPFRTEQIALLGSYNPVGTLTGFARIDDVLGVDGIHAFQETLSQPRYSIASPNAFALEGRQWIDCVPILTTRSDGTIEIAFPSYNCRPTWENDGEAQRALDALIAALDTVAKDIYIAPGEWVVWDNSRIVHRRGAIGEGKRELWRNYIRSDCSAMRAATGSPGPIFSARALLNAPGVSGSRYHVA